MNQEHLLFDRNHIWHPYASIINPTPCYLIKSAKQVFLTLYSGRKLIDGMSSWWATIHGYNHPRLNYALKSQISKISHVMFGGITHDPAISLCKKLIKITPQCLTRIFLSDSGSIAIEVAIKMILQYWKVLGKNKTIFLSIKNAYHGDTFAAMSVCDPKNSFHEFYNHFLPINLFAEAPTCAFSDQWNKKDIESFKYLIEQHQTKIAAVIIEPIVQGVGGMNFYNPQYLKEVRKLCDKFNIPLIIDEIATGFGRTGKLFAFEHSRVVPDVLCLGKALTGGTITLAATLTTDKIAHVICNSYSGCFMHGPTFMGNPLACAVATENISILQENKWKLQVNNIEKNLRINLLPLKNHPAVYDVRVLGAIGVIECIHEINIVKIQSYFVKQGVWIRPFKNIIYIIPAYIIDKISLIKLTVVVANALDCKNFFLKKNNLFRVK